MYIPVFPQEDAQLASCLILDVGAEIVLSIYRCPQNSIRWLFSRSSSNLNFLVPTHPTTKNVRLLWISIAPYGRNFRGCFRSPMFSSVYKYKYKYKKGLRSEIGQRLDKKRWKNKTQTIRENICIGHDTGRGQLSHLAWAYDPEESQSSFVRGKLVPSH